MNYFAKVLKYGLAYSYFAVLNIIFNILYAIFSALAFVSFIPMLDVLFKQTKKFMRHLYIQVLVILENMQKIILIIIYQNS